MSSKEIVKLLRANTGERDLHTVFGDFCSMSAIALRNRFDPHGHQEREDEYERTRERYSEAQWVRFTEALAAVAIELSTEPRDVLGEVYMQLEIASRDQGQFFTPYSVCQLMAAMQVPGAAEQLQTLPFLTVYEPACGAGAMVIAVAQELASQGVDCTTQLHVTADDLSLTAVHMAYIQLTLLGIPAVVNHRNSLTLEHFDAWPTSAHTLGEWDRKLSTRRTG
ncbi:N-6 DNA methylase [Microbacterium paraoxydans]|uniref:N-6 DNA methylase n=1 Tax=Microbacterium paraoxydans TaxID=199592 RepID=UPI00046ABE05|nr:N-6 DNA methylase [Microbacterium paraoxydans]